MGKRRPGAAVDQVVSPQRGAHGAPTRALLPSKFLSLQALCNPRLSPWPSPHRGAVDQWKEKSFPTCPPTISCPTLSCVKQLVINPPTCLQHLGLVLLHWRGSTPTRKALTKSGPVPHGVSPAPPIGMGCCMGGETHWFHSRLCPVGR